MCVDMYIHARIFYTTSAYGPDGFSLPVCHASASTNAASPSPSAHRLIGVRCRRVSLPRVHPGRRGRHPPTYLPTNVARVESSPWCPRRTGTLPRIGPGSSNGESYNARTTLTNLCGRVGPNGEWEIKPRTRHDVQPDSATL